MPKAVFVSRLAGFASVLALTSAGFSGDATSAPAAPPPVTKAAAVPSNAAPAVKPGVTVNVPPALAAKPQGFADLAERLLPMVVNISTSQTLRRRPRDAPPAAQAPQAQP